MAEFSMTVVVQINSLCARTTLFMARMTSLTRTLLAYFFTNIAFAFSLNSHKEKETESLGRLMVHFGF